MTLKKRRLGRGLEVLLADTPAAEHAPQPPLTNEQLSRQRQSLLQEAESLKSLLDEMETIIRTQRQ